MITLATLPNATAQEVFDQVKGHLLTQMQTSLNITEDACVYRGKEGLKCAAGCLVGEDEYFPLMENKGWGELVLLNIAPEKHKHLIQDLQGVHDMYDVPRWPEELAKVARRFNLKY